MGSRNWTNITPSLHLKVAELQHFELIADDWLIPTYETLQ